jgi:hypothetical protein
MTVYVDPLVAWGTSATWNHKQNCHLFASDVDELHAFAARLGLKRSWFQFRPNPRGTGLPHYDLTENKRRIAVGLGAVSVGRDEAVRLWSELGYSSIRIPGMSKPEPTV